MDQRKTHPSQANPARSRTTHVHLSGATGIGAHPASQLLNELTRQVRHTLKSADADAVHDLRVKIRRLSQAQTVFKSPFGAKQHKRLKFGLKRLMTLAGAVRDCDITMKLASKSKWSSAELRSRIGSERKDAEKVLLKSLNEWLSDNHAAAQTAPAPPVVDGSERRALLSIAKKFFVRGASAANGATPKELHKFRIAAKKFRYTLELFAPVYGANLKRWLEQIKEIQSRLGNINDYETARHLISGIESLTSNGSRRVVADLKAKQRAEVKEFHRLWTAVVARAWKHSLLPGLRNPKAAIQAPRPKEGTPSG